MKKQYLLASILLLASCSSINEDVRLQYIMKLNDSSTSGRYYGKVNDETTIKTSDVTDIYDLLNKETVTTDLSESSGFEPVEYYGFYVVSKKISLFINDKDSNKVVTYGDSKMYYFETTNDEITAKIDKLLSKAIKALEKCDETSFS